MASKYTPEEHGGYRAGDLVWVKNDDHHPWWPCRIHYPGHGSLCDRDGRFLVAFFGHRLPVFSLCHPSQLVPFAANFNEMSSTRDKSAGFVVAVNEAVEEFARALDYHMTCGCVLTEVRPWAGRLSVPIYEASEVLSRLATFASKAASFDGGDGASLEVGVVGVWLSAFRRFEGNNRRLQAYQEPSVIQGLADKGKRAVEAAPQDCDDGPNPKRQKKESGDEAFSPALVLTFAAGTALPDHIFIGIERRFAHSCSSSTFFHFFPSVAKSKTLI